MKLSCSLLLTADFGYGRGKGGKLPITASRKSVTVRNVCKTTANYVVVTNSHEMEAKLPYTWPIPRTREGSERTGRKLSNRASCDRCKVVCYTRNACACRLIQGISESRTIYGLHNCPISDELIFLELSGRANSLQYWQTIISFCHNTQIWLKDRQTDRIATPILCVALHAVAR